MRFDLFHTRADAHIQKAQEYLQAANVARLEHHVAAEHHSALADMYARRIAWLEKELSESVVPYGSPLRAAAAAQVESGKRGPESIVSLPRVHRAGMFEGV